MREREKMLGSKMDQEIYAQVQQRIISLTKSIVNVKLMESYDQTLREQLDQDRIAHAKEIATMSQRQMGQLKVTLWLSLQLVT